MAQKGQRWKPGCGWGDQSRPALQRNLLWDAVEDGHVTQRPYPDESITLRCENGLWKGGSFRLYPNETEIQLGPTTYVATPPTGGGRGKKDSVSPQLAWHFTVKGTNDGTQ
jgi:hypothetical protein